MSLTGMKKHVRILEDAELVTTEKVGRTRVCHAQPRGLADVHAWIETYRRMVEERLDRLGGFSNARSETSRDQRAAGAARGDHHAERPRRGHAGRRRRARCG
jgi:DNA-binding transcriptional ArsR family regulator